jgi:hypothetical protein
MVGVRNHKIMEKKEERKNLTGREGLEVAPSHCHGVETNLQCKISQVVFTTHLPIHATEHMNRNVPMYIYITFNLHLLNVYSFALKMSSANCSGGPA